MKKLKKLQFYEKPEVEVVEFTPAVLQSGSSYTSKSGMWEDLIV